MENTDMQEPPVKKQKTLKGMGNATAVREGSDPTLKRKNSLLHSQQFQCKNYRGALQEYFQKMEGGTMPVYTAVEKGDPKSLRKIFEATCTCKAVDNKGDVKGTGEAGTKKTAFQLAARDVIQKLELIPTKDFISTKFAPHEKLETQAPPQRRSKKKGEIPMNESPQYLAGNYRGALAEHFAKNYPGVRLAFDVVETNSRNDEGRFTKQFTATCRARGTADEKLSSIEAIGNAISKKSAIRQSAYQFMLKFNLITAAQHPGYESF